MNRLFFLKFCDVIKRHLLELYKPDKMLALSTNNMLDTIIWDQCNQLEHVFAIESNCKYIQEPTKFIHNSIYNHFKMNNFKLKDCNINLESKYIIKNFNMFNDIYKEILCKYNFITCFNFELHNYFECTKVFYRFIKNLYNCLNINGVFICNFVDVKEYFVSSNNNIYNDNFYCIELKKMKKYLNQELCNKITINNKDSFLVDKKFLINELEKMNIHLVKEYTLGDFIEDQSNNNLENYRFFVFKKVIVTQS